jgi:drug/metabolite transporter (DMT)-like permease
VHGPGGGSEAVTPASSPAPAGTSFGAAEIGLLAMVSLVWGAAYVFIRQGIVLGASPLAFAAVRYALSAAGFAVLAAVRGQPLPARRAVLASAGIGGILIIGIYGGLLYWGEQYTTGGYASVLASTAPLFTVAIGFGILASERLGALGLVGMAVGFTGTAVLVVPELAGSPLGSWQGPAFILGAMASTAVGTVLLRKYGGGPQNLWQIGTQFAVAGLLLGGGTLVLPVRTALPLSAGVLEALAILVVLSSLVGYFGYFALHHRVGPVRANIVAYLVPLVGVGIGTGLYAEPITTWELAGVAIVLAGVSLILWESSRRRRA